MVLPRPLMTLVLFLPALMAPVAPAHAGETWAVRLGFPADRRVLILHADDIGMCYEANRAAKDALENGHIQSASAMVPCPWFDEFADWYRRNPEQDVGLHLTLTSEWRWYRWGPIAPRASVPGLIDSDGYLHRRVVDVVRNARPGDVEREVRAQVERALSRGIRPGHLDTHMGTLYAHPAFTRAYLAVAEEYRIPAMVIELTPAVVERFRREGYPVGPEMIETSRRYTLPRLDDLRSIPGASSYEKFREGFFELVRGLEPGITEIIFHPSVDSETLRRITTSWRQRSWEARLFSDPEVKAFFERERVLFTNWKEMMRRHKPAPADGATPRKEERDDGE